MTQQQPTFCIFGGAQDTGNLGVSALGTATVQNLRSVFPSCRILLQQSSSRADQLFIPAPHGPIEVEPLFLHASFRYRDRRGTRLQHLLARAQKSIPACLLAKIDAGVSRKLQEVNYFLDLSAGDSFASIYGGNVLRSMISFKRIPLLLGKPLILLPQTFGPFSEQDIERESVRSIMQQASLVTSRDLNGLQELAAFLGPLNGHYTQCPDVAFTLAPCPVDTQREPFFADLTDQRPVLGLNVSGLLSAARLNFGINTEYSQLIPRIIDWYVNDVGGRVFLVPHVVDRPGHHRRKKTGSEDSDTFAATAFLNDLKRTYGNALGILTGTYNASEIKTLIGRCDFFIGSRMHACIAAISQHIPTVALAYSKKFEGVFGLAGLPPMTGDLRTQSIEQILSFITVKHSNKEQEAELITNAVTASQSAIRRYFSDTIFGLVKHTMR